MMHLHQDGVREGATPFIQIVDTRSVSQKGIPVGVGGHALELGRHRTSLLRQMPLRLERGKQSKRWHAKPTEGMEKTAMHGLI